MLTGGDDPTYRAMLTGSHTPTIRVDVWEGTTLLLQGLPVFGGSVSATLGNRVTRNLQLTTDGALYPFDPDGLLNPYSQSLRAWRGVVLADGREFLWPVFVGRITDTVLEDDGRCQVQATDRADDVNDASFPQPANSVVGNRVDAEFKRLVADGVPDAAFGACDVYQEQMPQLTWEHDRAGALDEIAQAVGSYWYALAGGQYVIRRIPWTVATAAVATLRDGEVGELAGRRPGRTRAGVYNSVTVTGERLDGASDPVYATVTDDNPTSPTRAGGPFGTRNQLLQLRTPTVQNTASDAARAALRRATARTQAFMLTLRAVDASLELGDTLTVDTDGRTDQQVVRAMTVPLTAAAQMTVETRAQVVGLVDTS